MKQNLYNRTSVFSLHRTVMVAVVMEDLTEDNVNQLR